MTVWRSQVRLKAATGDPADDAVNTFHFHSQSDPTNFENLHDLLQDFYEAIQGLINTQLADGECEIKTYSLSDEKPRVPRATRTFTLTGLGSGNGLPPQVAAVVSYSGEPVSGISRARQRGRFYVPWLNSSATPGGRWNATVVTGLANAAEDMMEAADASIANDWVVFSPTRALTDDPPFDNSWSKVTKIWVDNSVDIQRSRKYDATVREERTLGGA